MAVSGGSAAIVQPIDPRAVKAAVVRWAGNEGGAHFGLVALLQNPNPDDFFQWFVEFSRAFMIRAGRDYKPETLREATDWLCTTWLPHVRRENYDPAIIAEAVEHLKVYARWGGRLTSHVSKYAFAAKPWEYVPYDNRVRQGLSGLMLPVVEHDYADYRRQLKAYEDTGPVQAALSSLFANSSGALLHALAQQPNLAIGKQVAPGIITRELLTMRIVDKQLMLEGGFDPDKL
jgi:hypothetical protein